MDSWLHYNSMEAAPALTDLIRRAQGGDQGAMQQVFDVTYEDLRQMARARLNRSARGTLLDTTSLVHESYLRFVNTGALQIEDRAHFMRYASHVMRSVIVDFLRARVAERRGGMAQHVTLATHIPDSAQAEESEILRVNEALEELARLDPRLVQVVEMRYFAGMTEPEIAEALEVADRTVRRDWQKARVLLAKILE